MKPTSSDRDGIGISISKRDLTPADYLLTIQSYSFSVDTKVEKYESNIFQAGGYKWKLILYPRGNSKSNGEGYVSLYLKIADIEQFSDRWEVNVSFKLFVFDHKNNNYLTIQDADGTVRKFSEMKTEWGFEQLISLKTLFDTCNGYLVEDSCVFGAEVFVISHSAKSETFSMAFDKPPTYEAEKECIKDGAIIKEPHSFTWKLEKFSKTDHPSGLISKSFTVGDRNWTLMIYTKGLDSNLVLGNHLTLMLQLSNWNKFPSNTRVDATFKFKILDQLRNKYYEKTENFMFWVSKTSWSSSNFMSLSQLHRAVNGYIKDDTIIIEVEILKISPISPT